MGVLFFLRCAKCAWSNRDCRVYCAASGGEENGVFEEGKTWRSGHHSAKLL